MRLWILSAAAGLLLIFAGLVASYLVPGALVDLMVPVGITLCWVVNKFGPTDLHSHSPDDDEVYGSDFDFHIGAGG